MTCDVTIVEDTISPSGKRITTYQLRYWRALHSELMTHRVFSRNASSSRAVPVSKTLAQVWKDPAGPIHWGKNQAGMQAYTQLEGWRLKLARLLWKLAGRTACGFAYAAFKLGGAKQWVNRLLEPWQYISVIVTATEFDNFFELRCHPDAQPEFQELAVKMQTALEMSKPRKVTSNALRYANWHLPYVSAKERENFDIYDCVKFSAARCARVSYLTHDGRTPKPEEDIKLFDRLVGSVPLHASPIEHQAFVASSTTTRSGNFLGWIQYRQTYTFKV